MSPYITTKRAHMPAQRQNTTKESVRVLFSLNVLVAAFLICAIVGYLVMLNVLVSQSYTLKALEKRLGAGQDIQEKLNRDVTALQSSQELSRRVESLGLVAVEEMGHARSIERVAKSAASPVE